MTSRTIDIRCISCRRYLFSLWPDDSKGLEKDHFCSSDDCKNSAIEFKIKNPDAKVVIE